MRRSVLNMLLFILIFFSCAGCTYRITQIHTQGTASDVVDDTFTPNLEPDIQFPLPGVL